MNNPDFDILFSGFENIKVGVIGDVMLDTYIWGKVDRISPEAPVRVEEMTHIRLREILRGVGLRLFVDQREVAFVPRVGDVQLATIRDELPVVSIVGR